MGIHDGHPDVGADLVQAGIPDHLGEDDDRMAGRQGRHAAVRDRDELGVGGKGEAEDCDQDECRKLNVSVT